MGILFTSLVVRVVTHIETGTTCATSGERLHDVGIGIVSEFGPFDVGILIFKVAESAGAELEVEEDEGGQDQNASGDRHANDEALASTAGTTTGAR